MLPGFQPFVNTGKAYGQNKSKYKKFTLGSHSLSVKYCNTFMYFHVTNNEVKVTLTVLSGVIFHTNTGGSIICCFK